MRIFILAILSIFLFSCRKENIHPTKVQASYNLRINFEHTVDNDSLVLNQFGYQNAAGNLYSVTKLRYIISRIRLHRMSGEDILFDSYHLIDVIDENTLELNLGDVKSGIYTGLSFVFGMEDDINISYAYEPLNEIAWSWPEMLGGGYHFMQLEGRFSDTNELITSFATHMGMAREIINDSTNKFHSNYFEVNFLDIGFNLFENKQITIRMNVNQWYKDPYTWDFNNGLGLDIMGNYEAQLLLNENGKDIFSFSVDE